jgi:hypothetical protein
MFRSSLPVELETYLSQICIFNERPSRDTRRNLRRFSYEALVTAARR